MAGLFHPSDLDPSNTTAFVGNVNSDVTEEDLSQVFRRCGDIVSIKLLRAKGCAFVTYAERSSAERAIVELHGKVAASHGCRVSTRCVRCACEPLGQHGAHLQVIKNCAIRLCWGRRNSQFRAQLPGLGLGVAEGMGLPGYQAATFPAGQMLAGYGGSFPAWPPTAMAGYGAAGVPGMAAMPQPGIVDAALQAASLPGPMGLSAEQVRGRLWP